MPAIVRPALSALSKTTTTRTFASLASKTHLHPIRPAGVNTTLNALRTRSRGSSPLVAVLIAPNSNSGLFSGHRPNISIRERVARLANVLAINFQSRASYSSMRGNHHGEIHENPTPSEERVVADRSDDDPLAPELHRVIELEAGEAAAKPTPSEEDVHADKYEEDPLPLSSKWFKS
ncbi:hypothetical protein B0H66DRAFT_540354 [Apodospora peruviana]|uniref:Uncharacterized protein n=1 Tax=Apodospora peruviana TaxID=516989 RepID=A0AAE0MEV9_9PEZI|nr:hypothetical protein B0H66DRAFT_540354 [Apodospora peruviana]